MATPGGLVDKQELIDAQLDTAHLGRVVNSKDASGAPISESTNRTGGVNKTLDALETEYEQSGLNLFNQFETTFNSQFTYKRIGNISDYAGQSLPAADKLNSYQYPDDSDAWYAPVQGQAFPITIPADPTVSGSGWVLTASPNIYRGLWPDAGSSASKGETYQTQVSGTPTGQYFTALQNTTANPTGDNVNWREVVSTDSISQYTDIVYKASGGNSAVENMIAGIPLPSNIGDICRANGIEFERVAKSTPGVEGDFRAISDGSTLSLFTFLNSSFPIVSSVKILETGLYLQRTGNQSTPSRSFNDTADGTITDSDGNEFSLVGGSASISQLKTTGETNLTGLFVGALKTLNELDIDELTDINQAVIDGSSCKVIGGGVLRNFAGGTHRMMTITNSPDLRFKHAGFDANLDNVTNSVSKLDPVIDVQTSDRVFFECGTYTSGSNVHGVVCFVLFTNDSKHCRVVNAPNVSGVRTLVYWRQGCHHPKCHDIESDANGLQTSADHLIDFEASVSVVQDGSLDSRGNWVTSDTIFGGSIRRVVNFGNGECWQMTGATVNCHAKNNTQRDFYNADANTAGFKFDRVGPDCTSTDDYYSGQGIGFNDQNQQSYGVKIVRFKMRGTSDAVSSVGIRSGYDTSSRGESSQYISPEIVGAVNTGILTTQPGVTIREPKITARTPIDSGVEGTQREINNLRIEGGELISTHQHGFKGNTTGSVIKGVTFRGQSISAIRFLINANNTTISGCPFKNGDATDQIELISITSSTGCVVVYNPGLRTAPLAKPANTVILDSDLEALIP